MQDFLAFLAGAHASGHFRRKPTVADEDAFYQAFRTPPFYDACVAVAVWFERRRDRRRQAEAARCPDLCPDCTG